MNDEDKMKEGKLRAMVLLRDEWICCICSASHSNIVHHINAKNHYPEEMRYDPKYSITVCEQCHEKLQGKHFK